MYNQSQQETLRCCYALSLSELIESNFLLTIRYQEK